MNGPSWTPEEWADGIRRADRAFLGRALSLVESQLPADAERAAALFTALGAAPQGSFRLGITGNPGAGKSTLTEVMGVRWADSGHKVAVLAVDPSSSLHRGSILGDKTRMDQLSKHPNAFIRPVASGGQLGGVAASTRAAIQLLEHAGYTRIVLETVGVGQNETDAVHYVDGLLLVALPNSGDDVQGIKRGIMERADLIAVNKCDGSFAEAGQRAVHPFGQQAVKILQVAAEAGFFCLQIAEQQIGFLHQHGADQAQRQDDQQQDDRQSQQRRKVKTPRQETQKPGMHRIKQNRHHPSPENSAVKGRQQPYKSCADKEQQVQEELVLKRCRLLGLGWFHGGAQG